MPSTKVGVNLAVKAFVDGFDTNHLAIGIKVKLDHPLACFDPLGAVMAVDRARENLVRMEKHIGVGVRIGGGLLILVYVKMGEVADGNQLHVGKHYEQGLAIALALLCPMLDRMNLDFGGSFVGPERKNPNGTVSAIKF